jgi:hypothetical protein
MSPNPNPPMYIGIILTSEETQQDILLTFLLPHQNPNEFVLAVQVMNWDIDYNEFVLAVQVMN